MLLRHVETTTIREGKSSKGSYQMWHVWIWAHMDSASLRQTHRPRRDLQILQLEDLVTRANLKVVTWHFHCFGIPRPDFVSSFEKNIASNPIVLVQTDFPYVIHLDTGPQLLFHGLHPLLGDKHNSNLLLRGIRESIKTSSIKKNLLLREWQAAPSTLQVSQPCFLWEAKRPSEPQEHITSPSSNLAHWGWYGGYFLVQDIARVGFETSEGLELRTS